MIGSGEFFWIYSTTFNPSPLGYELYLHNYFKIDGFPIVGYAKHGAPFMNLGAGIDLPSILKYQGLQLGGKLDYWYEQPFSHGGAIVIDGGYSFPSGWGILAEIGFKSGGYLLGERIDQRLILRAGGYLQF
jgi:hypothetical protein